MGIQTSDRLWVGMEEAGVGGVEVFGTVTDWVDRDGRQPSAIVMLDEPLSAKGTVVGTDALTERTGAFLLISLIEPHSVQTWDQEEGTVQVILFSHDPHVPTEAGLWMDARCSYKRRTEITLEWWPDYGAGPLWRNTGRGGVPTELESLALSGDIKERLSNWNARYNEEALPIDGPGDQAWVSEGIALLDLARKELAGQAVILVTEPWWGEAPLEG